MKKLITILITLLLVLSIGACVEQVPTDTDLEDRVEVLETQVAELEQILIDIEIIEGLNGQREYYLPTSEVTVSNVQTVSAGTVELLGDELDKDKSPSYVLDVDGNYIPFEDVMDLLVAKYFGEVVTVNEATIGSQVLVLLNTNDIEQSEYLARLIMLIEELSNYDFYIIGGSELVIYSYFGGTSYLTIPIQTLRSSFITITPAVVYTQTYEIRAFNMSYVNATVQALYDEYVASELYIGYVLDFK